MTQQKVKEPQGAGQQDSPKYFIDEAWYEAQNRSFQYMISSRVEGLAPKEKPTTEKAPKRRGKAAAAPNPKIATMESLSKIEGFIRPELSVLESVFRLLLVHQNKPMDVEQISQELAEHGIGVMDTRVVNPQSLTRMLDADFHYGFRRYSED